MDKVYKLDEFFSIQKTNISNITAFLTQKWVIDIEETVKDLVATQGDKWDCTESRNAQEGSKLKSFLTVVKYMMQDSLAKIATRSIKNFIDAVQIKMPDKVILHASNNVENWFKRFANMDEDLIEYPQSLFYLEIEEDLPNEQYKFSEHLNNFMDTMMQLQNMGITALEDIDQVEKKILRDMFKVTGLMGKIHAPKLLDPAQGDQEAQENLYIWNGLLQLKKLMDDALEPLKSQLKIFKKIQNEIKLNPDEWFMSYYAALVQDLELSNNRDESDRKENEVEVVLM